MSRKLWLCALLCIGPASAFAEISMQPQNILNNVTSISTAPSTNLNMTLQDKRFLRKEILRDQDSDQTFMVNQTRFNFPMGNSLRVPLLLKFGATFIARSIALNSGVTAPQESFGIVPKTLNKAPTNAQEALFNIRD